jgi:hypothetical protein
VLAAGTPSPRTLGFVAASYPLKLLACHLGRRPAARKDLAEAAVTRNWETLLPLLVG